MDTTVHHIGPLSVARHNVLIAKSHACGDCFTRMPKTRCSNTVCYNTLDNPAINTSYSSSEISEDVLSIQSTTRLNPLTFHDSFSRLPSFLNAGDCKQKSREQPGLGEVWWRFLLN
ncbi:unnamed protein product [Fraxinus pennsylvanica]|uniref:Uncharacterized protein n=1 Tax=Fraxinus pennsylvanica TaxID=56036 RepID=A0AAD2E3V7_9LAMI|nr:unnamed protein product [Fraxinus pennsylvanica]